MLKNDYTAKQLPDKYRVKKYLFPSHTTAICADTPGDGCPHVNERRQYSVMCKRGNLFTVAQQTDSQSNLNEQSWAHLKKNGALSELPFLIWGTNLSCVVSVKGWPFLASYFFLSLSMCRTCLSVVNALAQRNYATKTKGEFCKPAVCNEGNSEQVWQAEQTLENVSEKYFMQETFIISKWL